MRPDGIDLTKGGGLNKLGWNESDLFTAEITV